MRAHRISVLIVEDERITAEDIREVLISHDFEPVYIAENLDSASSIYEKEQPDLILVDINLKSAKSGVDFVKKIRLDNSDLPVIYITANTDIAHREEAFETGPSAFIGKPFNEDNLILAVELAMDRLIRLKSESSLGSNDFLFLKSGKRYNKVQTSDIIYIKAEGSYSRFFVSGSDYLQSGNLGNFKEKLPSDFIRVHKSYIVNYKHVKSISSNSIEVGGEEIPIGRIYKENLKI